MTTRHSPRPNAPPWCRYTLTVEVYDDGSFFGILCNEDGVRFRTESGDSLPDLLTAMRHAWNKETSGPHPFDWEVK